MRIAALTDTAQNLRAAMDSRTTIDVAAGIIMAQKRCSHDVAIAILMKASSLRNIKLCEVAAALGPPCTINPGDHCRQGSAALRPLTDAGLHVLGDHRELGPGNAVMRTPVGADARIEFSREGLGVHGGGPGSDIAHGPGDRIEQVPTIGLIAGEQIPGIPGRVCLGCRAGTG